MDESEEQSFRGFRSRWIERATLACDAEEGQANKGNSDYSPSLNLDYQVDPNEDNFSDLMKEDSRHEGDAHSLASFEVIADRDSGSRKHVLKNCRRDHDHKCIR